jgi:phospholipase C
MPESLAGVIDHVVVLMFENRSFDHLLGFMKSPDYAIDGLDGTEYNLENPADPTSAVVRVSKDAPLGPDPSPDPNHNLPDVTIQLYGSPQVSPAPVEHNNGFVFDYAQITGNAGAPSHRIMRCHDPAGLPALTTLAREFALCDHWFSSVPGPTWPNRLFLHAATSDGSIDNNPRDYDMPSIFQHLASHGQSWKVYFHDVPQALALSGLRSSRGNFVHFDDAFQQDCTNGTLPNYAFVEPRYFDFLWLKANDQHPPHSVVPGEQLLASVYQPLRASPLWERSALIVTWDEHGGIYDHVLPPPTVNPDGKIAPGFAFDRLGVRVPAVIASPWIPRGRIDHRQYEHASVPAFLKLVFELPDFLTERDRAANTFAGLFSLDAPRSDAPATLPQPAQVSLLAEVAEPVLRQISAEAVLAAKAAGTASAAVPSDLQASLLALAQSLPLGESPFMRAVRLAASTATEHDAAVQVLRSFGRYLGH